MRMAEERKNIRSEDQGVEEVSHPQARISGNSFFPEMRAICNMFDLTSKKYIAEECDLFSSDG